MATQMFALNARSPSARGSGAGTIRSTPYETSKDMSLREGVKRRRRTPRAWSTGPGRVTVAAGWLGEHTASGRSGTIDLATMGR